MEGESGDVDIFERDLALGVHDVDSELRRVSSNILGMEGGDLKTVERKGAYVKSSCMDVWCAVTNKDLSKQGRRDVLILTMPTSEEMVLVLGQEICRILQRNGQDGEPNLEAFVNTSELEQ